MKKPFVKRTSIALLSLLLLSSLAVGCSSGQGTKPAVSEDKQVVLKLGTNTAPSHPENKAANKFAEIVKEKSGGKIEVQVYDSAKLGDHKERLEGLRMGTIDMTTTSVGYMATYEPVMTIFEMPYMFKNKEQEFKVYDGQVGKDIDTILQKTGFRVLGYFDMGARQVTNSKKPIKSPEDLKGVKLRVPDTKASIDGLKAMGASPTPMNFSELYMALQQKTVDGQENPFSIIESSKFYEVQKYVSLTNHQLFAQVFLFSTKNWDKLTKDQQKILTDAAAEATTFERKLMQDEENSLLAKLKERGMEVNEVDVNAFMEAVKPLKEQYSKEFGQVAKDFFTNVDAVK